MERTRQGRDVSVQSMSKAISSKKIRKRKLTGIFLGIGLCIWHLQEPIKTSRDIQQTGAFPARVQYLNPYQVCISHFQFRDLAVSAIDIVFLDCFLVELRGKRSWLPT